MLGINTCQMSAMYSTTVGFITTKAALFKQSEKVQTLLSVAYTMPPPLTSLSKRQGRPVIPALSTCKHNFVGRGLPRESDHVENEDFLPFLVIGWPW